MSTPFQQPPPAASSIKTAELNGCLVLIYAERFQADCVMPDGKTIDGVEAAVHVLDGPKGGEVLRGMIFQRVMVGSLRNAVGGDPVLGRVGQGVANPGKSAPWVLNPFTDADAALAMGYIARARPGIQQAAPAAPVPTPAAAAPAAASPYPAAASPATASAPAAPAPVPAGPVPGAPLTAEQIANLPANVQALLAAAAGA